MSEHNHHPSARQQVTGEADGTHFGLAEVSSVSDVEDDMLVHDTATEAVQLREALKLAALQFDELSERADLFARNARKMLEDAGWITK